MKPRRVAWPLALALAGLGAWLAVDAWLAGSLFRYRLVAYVAAGVCASPLVTLLLFGDRARRLWRKAAFASLPLLACLALGELAFRLFGPAREEPAALRPDARLGHTIGPGTAGTDAAGFRNPEQLRRADVLFVGDSQTWGFAVGAEQTFTRRVAAVTGRRCYQMAIPSYGPVQYLELVRRGLALAPEHVVVTIYFGNDLIDAVDYAALEGAARVRTPGRRYRVRHHVEFGGGRAPNAAMTVVDAVLDASRLLDAAARVVKSRLQGGLLDDQPGAVPFEHPTAATILLPGYRRPAVDPARPHVLEGLAVTARCCEAMAALCAERGAHLLVATLPTKEYCYARFGAAERVADGGATIAALQAAEREARLRLQGALAAAGIAQLDLVEPLVEAMAQGPCPWFATGDGHLNAAGHAVVADALVAALGR